jgi:hypothetical protein
MDWFTFFATIGSASGVTLAVAHWLTKRLIDHRLSKDLSSYKANLDERLATAKAALDERLTAKKVELDAHVAESKALLDAALRREVEDYLGDRAAEREYRLEARKRLYAVIGPLRFQLIIAAAEFANRVANIGTGTQPYSLSIGGYFGKSTAFRMLRVFGLSELIERQVTHADFSVDPTTIGLLRFKSAAFRCMSSSSVSLGHPREDWSDQVEHIFYDTLTNIAATMIVTDSDSHRIIRFDEFSALVAETEDRKRLAPLPRLLENFHATRKPLFWLRLVALAHVCATFVEAEGPQIGIPADPFETTTFLQSAQDEFINSNLVRYKNAFDLLSNRSITGSNARSVSMSSS